MVRIGKTKLLETLNKNVYITFDVDYFDPSIMPSTGTPEPDGFLVGGNNKIIKETWIAKKCFRI